LEGQGCNREQGLASSSAATHLDFPVAICFNHIEGVLSKAGSDPCNDNDSSGQLRAATFDIVSAPNSLGRPPTFLFAPGQRWLILFAVADDRWQKRSA
jgi:hypothetical protein